MSEQPDRPLAPRLQEFQSEVENLGITGGAANPERTGMITGLVLLVLGIVLALIGVLAQRGDDGLDDATGLLAEVVSANNGLILVVFGLSLALVGGIVWVRNSLTRYFRYWLVRLVYEDRANTDRLIDAIREGR